jgi:uncharacterized protein (TIGR02453 family)
MHIKALIEFLSGLEENNNRPWFAWNKPAYDVLREEFETLVADVTARVAKFDRGLGPVDAKKALFRIYRDTRFAKDKTPYKTYFSAAIRDRAKKGLEPGYYFHIDHKGIMLVGGGIYRPEPDILKRVRTYIAAHPQSLTKLMRNARFRRTYDGFIREDALIRPPKGFDVDTPQIETIKLRHYFGMIEVSLNKRPPKDLAADISAYFNDLLPLMQWLRIAAAETSK